MVRKSYMPEQIINKLREVEVLISQGATTMEASRIKLKNKILRLISFFIWHPRLLQRYLELPVAFPVAKMGDDEG